MQKEEVREHIFTRKNIDSKAAVALVRAVKNGMIAQYPVDVFGAPGLFVDRVIARVCNEIIDGLEEIIKDE